MQQGVNERPANKERVQENSKTEARSSPLPTNHGQHKAQRLGIEVPKYLHKQI